MFRAVASVAAAAMLVLLFHNDSSAQELNGPSYSIGTPSVSDLWVDPVNGRDSNSGASRSQALRTLAEAWDRVPRGVVLTSGYRIMLTAGTYSVVPNYMESRWGTASAPVMIKAADGNGTALITANLNVFDTRYLYLLGINVRPQPAGDAFHCERCDHVLLKDGEFSGGARVAQETVKFNQSSHVYVEDCDIHGAWDNAFDCVGVQYGHLYRNRIHDAADWCGYLKGGSAYFTVEGNEFYDCGTGGFSTGQGAGFEFMVSPWLHYEAYDVKAVNNIVHDTEGAGLGVNGGYNILFAHNTLYRVGSRSHALEVVFGYRSCDGSIARCSEYLALGGWGRLDNVGELPIPNRNVFIYNNIIYNPPGFQSPSSHLAIYGPRAPMPGTNVPSPVRSDVNLRIRGNLFWNGRADLPLGVGDDAGCPPENAACNEAQLRADNVFNTVQPQLVDPAHGNFQPLEGGNVFGVTGYAMPSFSGGDREPTPRAPEGNLSNSLNRDIRGYSRVLIPGAYSGPVRPRAEADMYLPWNGFLGMVNILELVNRSASDETVGVGLYDINGDAVSLVWVPVAAGGQRDVIVNDLPGFRADSYGLVTLDYSSSSIDGRITYYHNRLGDSQRFDFAYAMPFRAPVNGTAYVPFNTYQPSEDPAERSYQVANWLSIVNLDTSTSKGFSVVRFAEDGSVLSEQRVSVPPFGRADIEAGHVAPGPSRVGLNRIVPDDAASAYQAFLVRYGEKAPAGSPVNEYSFAFPIAAASAAPAEQYVPISTGGDALNWLELANYSASPLMVDVDIFDGAGSLVADEAVTLAPFGQHHLNVGLIVGANASGSARVTAERAGALGALSMFYFRTDSRSISAMYGTAGVQGREASAVGSYNLYLNMFNWLKLVNTSASPNSLRIRVASYDRVLVLQPHAAVDLGLHDPLFGTVADSYGTVSVEGRDFFGDVLRLKSVGTRFDFVFPTALR